MGEERLNRSSNHFCPRRELVWHEMIKVIHYFIRKSNGNLHGTSIQRVNDRRYRITAGNQGRAKC